jgi:hypothetical protein
MPDAINFDAAKNVGEFVPSPDMARQYAEAFHQFGPYLVAILFLFLGVSLILFNRSRIASRFGSVFVVCAIASTAFAIWVWLPSERQRQAQDDALANDERRYVLVIPMRHVQNLSLDEITSADVPSTLRNIADLYLAPAFRGDAISFVITSKRPITDQVIDYIFIETKGHAEPLVLCLSDIKNAEFIKVDTESVLDPAGQPHEHRMVLAWTVKGSTNGWKPVCQPE